MVKVNFADVGDFEKLESGKYHFAVTDIDLKEGTEKKPNSEWWNIEITVQDGEKKGQKEWLFAGLPSEDPDSHYDPITIVQLLKATVGQHDWSKEDLESGEFEVEMDDLMGLEFIGTVKPQKRNKEFNQVRISPFDPDEWDSDENLLP